MKFTTLDSAVQLININYIYRVVQPSPELFHLLQLKLCTQQTITPSFLAPTLTPVPGNHHSTFHFYEFDDSTYPIQEKSYNIYALVPGLFHLASCLQGSFTLALVRISFLFRDEYYSVF